MGQMFLTVVDKRCIMEPYTYIFERGVFLIYIFLDTEFTNFVDCDLISLGAISEDGQHEFYVEITDYETSWCSDFVKGAIIPLLDNAKYGMTFVEAGAAFKQWFEALPDNKID